MEQGKIESKHSCFQISNDGPAFWLTLQNLPRIPLLSNQILYESNLMNKNTHQFWPLNFILLLRQIYNKQNVKQKIIMTHMSLALTLSKHFLILNILPTLKNFDFHYVLRFWVKSEEKKTGHSKKLAVN